MVAPALQGAGAAPPVAPDQIAPEQVVAAQDALTAQPDDLGGTSLPASLGMRLESIPWMYWRKKDGWIVVQQTDASSWQKLYLLRGWQPLRQYGLFVLNDKKSGFDARDQYAFLLRHGGKDEFGIEQVIELGWHRRPPRDDAGEPYRWPQHFQYDEKTGAVKRTDEGQTVLADGSVLPEAQCGVCGQWRRDRERLKEHEGIAHKQTAAQSELGRIIKDGTTGEMAGVMKALVEAQSKSDERMARLEAQFLAVLERLAPARAERGRERERKED